MASRPTDPSTPITTVASRPSRLDTPEALAEHLAGLGARDPHLAAAIARAGEVSLRTNPAGFEGLARIVCGQQVSVASARAIWGRVEALGATHADAYLGLDEAALRGAGLSRGKYEAIRGVALAELEGEIVFAEIDGLPAEEAIATLTRLKGIGPWTAEIYLLFCAAHPDVFPAGDLALQKAVAHAFGLPARPGTRELIARARDWSPHRGAAALMFWRYFAWLRSAAAKGEARGPDPSWDTL